MNPIIEFFSHSLSKVCRMFGDCSESSVLVTKSANCSTCGGYSPVGWSASVAIGGSSPCGYSVGIFVDSLCCAFSSCVRTLSGWVCCSDGISCLFSLLVCSVSYLYHLFRLAYSGSFFFPLFWGIGFGLGLDSFLFISVQIYGELQLLVHEFLD